MLIPQARLDPAKAKAMKLPAADNRYSTRAMIVCLDEDGTEYTA